MHFKAGIAVQKALLQLRAATLFGPYSVIEILLFSI